MDQGRRGGHPPKGARGSSHSGASIFRQGSSGDATQQLISLLQRLNVGSSSDSSSSARLALASQQSSTPPAPPSSSIMSPWILDSGASFHMTPNSTHLTSVSSTVQIEDGTSLPVAGRGTLSTSFHVPQLLYSLCRLVRSMITTVVWFLSFTSCVQDHCY